MCILMSKSRPEGIEAKICVRGMYVSSMLSRQRSGKRSKDAETPRHNRNAAR